MPAEAGIRTVAEAIVLSYLLERRLSAPDFEHRLEELSARGRRGQPGVAAARAILVDWQARAAS